MSTAATIVRLAKLVEMTLTDLGLTVNQYRMLTLIAEGSASLAELGYRLAMKPPNVTALIDGLVGRDLVIRARDPGDGRRWRLDLTDSGGRLLADAEQRAQSMLVGILTDDPDRTKLLAGLDRWEPILDQLGVDLRASLQE